MLYRMLRVGAFAGRAGRAVAGCALALGAAFARAGIEAFAIESLYSNADGSLQFVVLRETQNQPGNDAWLGKTFKTTRNGVTQTFTFPGDLPGADTAGKRVLIASQGLAALGLIAPDFVVPDRFLASGRRHARRRWRGPARVRRIADGWRAGDGARWRHGAERRAQLRRREFGRAGRTRHRDRISQRRARPLFHQRPRARPRSRSTAGASPAGRAPGESFKVYPSPASGSGVNPVCRFYIPPAHGNSHFFSASPQECAAIAQKAATDPAYSGYVLESSAAFFIALPDTATGDCPAGTSPVYRLWNERPDSNHRYTTSGAVTRADDRAGLRRRRLRRRQRGDVRAAGHRDRQVVAGAAAPFGALVSDGCEHAGRELSGLRHAGRQRERRRRAAAAAR